MATIQFNIDRMNVIHNRIGEMINQLNTAMQSDQTILNTIASNIQNEGITNTLKSYADNNIQEASKLVENLQKMDEFLVSQMSAYSAVDEEAQSTITSVNNILSQIQ